MGGVKGGTGPAAASVAAAPVRLFHSKNFVAGAALTAAVVLLLVAPGWAVRSSLILIGALLGVELATLVIPERRVLVPIMAVLALAGVLISAPLLVFCALAAGGVTSAWPLRGRAVDGTTCRRKVIVTVLICVTTVVPFGVLALLFETWGGAVAACVILAVSARDISANWIGRHLGGRTISPVSPRKTYRGAFVAILIAGSLVYLPLSLALQGRSSGLVLAVLVVTGVFGQLGDLLGSSVKRSAGVKDSGWMLGGQGGVLDTVDSLALAAPAVFLLLRVAG